MNWYIEVLRKYAVFTGRARRKEYWYFVLFNAIFSVALSLIDLILILWSETVGIGLLNIIYSLAVLIPFMAVSVRRLHDTGRTGWWMLMSLIPIIGWLVLLVFNVQGGDPDANRFGPNPKSVPDDQEKSPGTQEP
jgi:uncharacterized membrane protein YhaH (DUF805 family)